jgi:hypothetical protein
MPVSPDLRMRPLMGSSHFRFFHVRIVDQIACIRNKFAAHNMYMQHYFI